MLYILLTLEIKRLHLRLHSTTKDIFDVSHLCRVGVLNGFNMIIQWRTSQGMGWRTTVAYYLVIISCDTIAIGVVARESE